MCFSAGDSRACPLPIDERGRVVKPGQGIENPLELNAEGNLVKPVASVRSIIPRRHARVPDRPQQGTRRAASTSLPRIYMSRRSTGGKRRHQNAAADGGGAAAGASHEAPSAVAAHSPSPVPAPALVAPRAPSPVPAAPTPVQQSLVRSAARYRIHPLFCEDGLWLTAARPRDIVTIKPHHVCSICWNVKCHPVTSGCGHSHCFVCIRLWLQESWNCPDCKKRMFYRPMRQWAEEHEINSSYPGWTDETAVSYSWVGLKFAKDPLYPYYG
ncbi:hypothetical protein C8R43DRAFT_1127906 [Mycena crocata]|nr:hypothetical protein C8R43DRAFT_1127906 [Mycena crocata]